MTPLSKRGARAHTRALSALFLLGLASAVRAQPQAPPPPKNFFTDTSGVVPADTAARLEQRLREFEKTSSNQILVVVADRMPEGFASLEEYTNRTAEAWRVGDKKRDNGAVLFVFVSDRKIRIEVGYGLEGALPDALASRIINDEIAPHFRAGRYGEGLEAGVDAILRATKGEYQGVASKRGSGGVSGQTVLIVLIILLFLFVGVVIPFLREVGGIRDSRTYSSRGWSNGRGRGFGSGGGWGGWSGGGGSSWGGGGGFSGGGGSFGGGGASGGW